VAVVGIGADGPAGLSAAAREHVAAAEVLAGGRRHLSYFPDWTGERLVINANISHFIARLRETYPMRKTVVLASGDPLFYGIGRALVESLPKDDLLFFPQVSSMQLAFAQLRESWEDACTVSLHGRDLAMLLPAVQRRESKIAVFTDSVNDPAAIAALLIQHGFGDDYTLCVCENLAGPEERISRLSPREAMGRQYAPLNVVVLLRRLGADHMKRMPLLGLRESAFRHRSERQGIITKRGPRLLALAALELYSGDIMWDIGAGSGSVSIEAARLAPALNVFPVERDPSALENLRENIAAFQLERVHLVAGEAPEALVDLPDPDAVFVGGSGGKLTEILAAVANRLKPGGRLVLNCITIETYTRSWSWLSERGWQPEATSVQLAHSRSLGPLHCFEPESLLFIVRAQRQ
jgi:precorrin-6Y C5,15-methyltransferase (decarboxylating)